MDTKILFIAQLAVLLLVFISCESSETKERQRSINTNQAAAMDTSNMQVIDGVPVIPTPGAKIDKDKVIEALDEGNTSYSEILKAREEDEIADNIESLQQLLQNERVLQDEELQFMTHNMLGNSYLKMYNHSEQSRYLNQAEEHIDSAISLFEENPDYKADLADAYTGRIAVHSLRENYEEVVSQMKYLVDEYQDIGYGLYKNWFASRQVDALYNLINRELIDSAGREEVLAYLTEAADKYDNEVGVTAQMVLARHYAENGYTDKADELVDTIEQHIASLNNTEFKEDKWLQFKTEVESIKKGETESVAQQERDTLFYEIEPKMIEQANIAKDEQQSSYRILVQLKNDYHPHFAEQTTDNIGNYFAVVYDGEVISPGLPTIQTGISGGRFSIGPFNTEEGAEKILRQISG